MAGRLDMQREVVDGVLAGQYYYFPDAVNPAPVPPYPVPITERQILELRIMGATGHDCYTERLAGTDLSRVLYVYGIEDMIVGRLTEDEVGFLTSSGSSSGRCPPQPPPATQASHSAKHVAAGFYLRAALALLLLAALASGARHSSRSHTYHTGLLAVRDLLGDQDAQGIRDTTSSGSRRARAVRASGGECW